MKTTDESYLSMILKAVVDLCRIQKPADPDHLFIAIIKTEGRGPNFPEQPDQTGLIMYPSIIPKILTYSQEPVRIWRDFADLAARIRPMPGICASTWEHALTVMKGPECGGQRSDTHSFELLATVI